MSSAVEKWLPRLAAQIPCAVQPPGRGPCPLHAVAACDVCQRPICLEHARVDYAGEAICIDCVARAVAQAQAQGFPPPPPQDPPRPQDAPPPPRPDAPTREQVRKAYRRLKVPMSVSNEELRRAWRREMGRWHPDRPQGDADKFRKVGQAYEVICAHRGIKL